MATARFFIMRTRFCEGCVHDLGERRCEDTADRRRRRVHGGSEVRQGTVYAMVDPWLYNEYTDGGSCGLYDNYAAGEELVRWVLEQVPSKGKHARSKMKLFCGMNGGTMKTILMADPVRYQRMTTEELRETFLLDRCMSRKDSLNYVDLDRAVVGMVAPWKERLRCLRC